MLFIADFELKPWAILLEGGLHKCWKVIGLLPTLSPIFQDKLDDRLNDSAVVL